MTTLLTLLDIACGRPIPDEDAGRARRMQLVVTARLASLVFAACWGLAIGSSSTTLAVANVYKVPMVVLLSCAFAAPAGILAWRLSGAAVRGTDLALGFAGGMFGGTLVLAVLAPLVALYYHSSAFAGPLLADGTALVAVVLGAVVFQRLALRAPGARKNVVGFVVPGVILGVQAAAMLQLVALASPILPDPTMFRHGVDGIVETSR